MIKRLLLAGALLSSAATLTHAQAIFRAGYVLPLNADTLKGEVDARGDQRNARLARFRPAGGTVTEYTPGQLRAYGIRGGL